MKNPDISFEAAKERNKRGRRGKAAESAVQAVLTQLKGDGVLDFIRLLDTRSCGRPVPAAISDYIVFNLGAAYALEVKEVAKGGRLPKNSFPQIRRMQSPHVVPKLLVRLMEREEWWAVNVNAMDPEATSWKIDESSGVKVNLEDFFRC